MSRYSCKGNRYVYFSVPNSEEMLLSLPAACLHDFILLRLLKRLGRQKCPVFWPSWTLNLLYLIPVLILLFMTGLLFWKLLFFVTETRKTKKTLKMYLILGFVWYRFLKTVFKNWFYKLIIIFETSQIV